MPEETVCFVAARGFADVGVGQLAALRRQGLEDCVFHLLRHDPLPALCAGLAKIMLLSCVTIRKAQGREFARWCPDHPRVDQVFVRTAISRWPAICGPLGCAHG